MARRLAPIPVFFTIAFVVDLLTQQRYSAVFGSAAIVASVWAVFPTVRATALALAGYGGIWLGFNLVRAFADDAGLAVASQTAVSRFETTLFGGTLPSQWLQHHFHDVAHIQFQDIALALVHLSFFIIPFGVALGLWFKQRSLFTQYCWATAITLSLGLIGFILVPTAPPWLSDPESVTRVTILLVNNDGGTTSLSGAPTVTDPGLGFEPNHIAAIPSVHVAAAVLVFLVLRTSSRHWAWLGGTYALAMTLAVVYLGEHFLLDAILGWIIALIGWSIARRFTARVMTNDRQQAHDVSRFPDSPR